VALSDVVLTDFTWTPFHPWKLIYQDPENSSTPGKPVLQLRQVNVLVIYTESNHEYRLSDPTAVVHSADWLDLNICPHAEDALPRIRRLLSSTPGKPVSPWRKVNVLAIYTKSNHEYRLFDPTAVVCNADWLDLNTFSRVEDALPRSKNLLNTWKNGFTVTAIQCSGHVTGSHHEYTLSFLSPRQWHSVLVGFCRIPIHPWSQSGLLWFSINGQNIDSPWWQNRFFRCWGALCTLVDHLSGLKMCPCGVSQHCLPSQLDQKICIYGLIQYQWPEHWLAFMAQPVFQVLMCLLVLGRASLMGERVSMWSQSSLCATIVG